MTPSSFPRSGASNQPRAIHWQLAVYVGDERGHSRYRYETITGSRRDAERRLTQLMADVDSGRLGPSRADTLEDLSTAWWDARADQLSPASIRAIHGILRSMFKAAVRWGYAATNPLREIDPHQDEDLTNKEESLGLPLWQSSAFGFATPSSLAPSPVSA
jgi:hypothetical protein